MAEMFVDGEVLCELKSRGSCKVECCAERQQ